MNLYLWIPRSKFVELRWRALLVAIGAWNVLWLVFQDHRTTLRTMVFASVVVLLVSCAAEAARSGAVVSAVDWALDVSRAFLAVAIALLMRLAVQPELCGEQSLVVRVGTPVLFLLVYVLAGRYLRPSLRGSIDAGGHAWMHGINSTRVSIGLGVIWGLVQAAATVYILSSQLFGQAFIENSLFFPALGALADKNPVTSNDLVHGFLAVFDPVGNKKLPGCGAGR